MSGDFAFDEEIIRRLVERIIKLEVQHETMKRRVDAPFLDHDIFGVDEGGENNKLILWNRILRLEEGQQLVQKHVQELFANVMDFELQSRGEPCYLHEEGSDINVKPKQKLKWKEIIGQSFNNSSVTGIKYLTMCERPAISLFWSLILLLSVMLCGVFVYHAYCYWLRSATVSHDTLAPLGLIPFPAVTVCPERKISATFPLDNLLQQCNQWACTREQFESLSASAFLCPSLMQNIPLQAWSNFFNISSPEFIEEVVQKYFSYHSLVLPTCSEDISSYHWPDSGTDNCSKAFQTLYIDDRVCYSYNLQPASQLFLADRSPRPAVLDETGLSGRPDWGPNNMYRPDPLDKTTPVHVDSAGESFKLTLALERKTFRQTSCTENHFQTYEIAVHHPSELPSRANHPYLRLPLAHTLYVSVTPRLVATAFHPSSQECLPRDEGRLQLFRHYSQANCRLECRVTCSLSLCGCVPLYLPRVDNSSRWCGLLRRYCPDTLVPDLMRGKITWEAIAKHYRKEIRDDLHETITDHLYNYPGQEALTDDVLRGLAPNCSCDCPPECSALSYHLETQVVPLSHGRDKGYWIWPNKSEVHVYYKEGEDVFTATQTSSIFGFTQFLAACGGLLALFTGVSVLSVFELLYLLAVSTSPLPHSSTDRGSDKDCLRRRQEWDKTVQTDTLFITDGTITMGY